MNEGRMATDQRLAQASTAEGGDEHANERTWDVRERARAGANARMGRISEPTS
jgi:hypothetical protein